MKKEASTIFDVLARAPLAYTSDGKHHASFRFVDGIMHELGLVAQKQDCPKGVLSLEYSKA